MGKIFVEPSAVGPEFIRITDSSDVHHLTRVLRIKRGEKLEISDGLKWEYTACAEEIGQDEILCRIEDKQAHAREPKTRVTLFQGFPKAGKLDYIVQKCVELGVDTVVPVYMDRSVVTDKGKNEKKQARWQKIADEASMQCRRSRLSQIRMPLRFKEMTEELSSFDLLLFPYENEENYTIKDALMAFKERTGAKGASTAQNAEEGPKVAVVIGPEGGFSEKEAEALKEMGAETVSLGKTILRTETAGPAALSMIMYEMEM